MKKILVCIHGGDSWKHEAEYVNFLKNELTIAPYVPRPTGWKTQIRDIAYTLGWDVYMPEFPSKLNARYSEWVIVFERILDYIEDSLEQNASGEGAQVVFVGHSLGGCFLLSYLSSLQGYQRFQSFVTPGMQMLFHSVAGCVSAGDFVGPVTGEDWDRFAQIASNYTYHLWHSEDDTIVPFTDATQVLTRAPACIFHPFTDQFHFVGSYFPELQQTIF